MKRLALSIVLASMLAGATAQASELDNLRWIEGTWKMETDRGDIYESWRVLSDRTFEGESYFIDPGGNRKTSEFLLLVEMGGEVFFIPRPLRNPLPVAFRLTSAGESEVVFENPDHDFPQKITYALNPDGTVRARVEAPGKDGGEPRVLELHYTRVD